MITRIRADYQDMPDAAFPKLVRLHKEKEVAECPESALQSYAEAVLRAKRLPYLHLPLGMFKALFKSPTVAPYIKRILKDYLAGWPDLIIILPITTQQNLCVCLELKTTIGKLHGLQKVRSKEMAWIIARSRGEIDRAIKKAEWMAEHMRQDLKTTLPEEMAA